MLDALTRVCRACRQAKNPHVRLAEVADAAGKDQAQISRFENGLLGWPRDLNTYLDGYVIACGLDGDHVLWERALKLKYDLDVADSNLGALEEVKVLFGYLAQRIDDIQDAMTRRGIIERQNGTGPRPSLRPETVPK